MNILACDYDDTLKPHYKNLLSSNRISLDFDQQQNSFAENIIAIEKFLAKGNIVLITTGRHYEGIIEELNQNRVNYSYLSCNNGTELYDKNGKLLYCNPMKSYDVGILQNLKLSLGDEATVKIRSIIDNNEEKYVASSLTIYDKNIFDDILPLLQEKLINSAVYFEYPKIRVEGKFVNKVDTIEIIRKIHNIPKENIYTIGDGLNDLEMITKYNGYTMIWGNSEVQQEAINKYISVSEFIYKELLKNTNYKKELYNLSDDIVFPIELKEYDFIINLIEKYKTIYTPIFEELMHEEANLLKSYYFDKEMAFIKRHNEVIKKLIVSLLKDFNMFEHDNICTFFTGSFARGTNKIDSDLDFHFAYTQENYNYIKYEEMFYFVLSQIMNKQREKIHPMIFTANDEQVNSYIINNMSDSDMLLSFECEKLKKIEYIINHKMKKRMYLQLYGDKTLDSLYEYLSKWSCDKFPHEWMNNFQIISGEELFDKMYQYISLKQNSVNRYIMSEKISNFVDDMENFTENFDNSYIKDVREMKMLYQQEEFKRIFNFYSLVREIAIMHGNDIQFNNLPTLMSNEFVNNFVDDERLFNDTYKYFWDIKGMIKTLKQFNLPYSIHTAESLPENININFEEMNNSARELNLKMVKTLKKTL